MENLPATYVEGFHDLEAVKAMKYSKLGKTNLMISKLALGGATFGVHFGSFDEDEAIAMIRSAIQQGINYIDTGYWYGQGKSEIFLGKALKGIPRQAYYIGTKAARYEFDIPKMFDFSVEKTRQNVKDALERLGLDYVDIIQVHDIEFAPSMDVVLTQTLPELSRQVSEGRARFIGITGYPPSALKECVERSNINISCILTYSRMTLLDDTLLEYIPFFKKQNLGIINGAAPCMGLLSNRGPQDWHLAEEETKKLCAEAAKVCKEKNVELAKLAAWYSMESCEDITTHLIGMQTRKELELNLHALKTGLTPEERQVLKEIQEKYLSKVPQKHWEGKELKTYWATLGMKK